MWNAFPANKEYLSQHTCLVSKSWQFLFFWKSDICKFSYEWCSFTWSQTGMMVDWSTLMNVSSATPRTRLTWKTRPNQMMFFISSVDHKNIRGCLTIRAAYCSTCTTETVAWKVKSYSETRWGKVNKTLLKIGLVLMLQTGWGSDCFQYVYCWLSTVKPESKIINSMLCDCASTE